MQAKGLIRFFAITLILICLYQLTFTFIASRVENKAASFALQKVTNGNDVDGLCLDLEGKDKTTCTDSVNLELKRLTKRYLDSVSSEPVLDLGFTEITYRTAKERQLNLGLDLQGGMSVVLQVSLEETIQALSGDSKDPNFLKALALAKERQKDAQEDLVTLFGQSFNELAPDARLAAIFATPDNKEHVDFNSSNDQVLSFISEEAIGAVNRTFNILRTRIDRFGVTQPNISLQEATGRIVIELPGVDDPDRVRKLLQSTAKLEFWETFDNGEVINYLVEANKVLYNLISYEDTTKGGVDSTSNETKEKAAIEDVDPLSALTASADDTSGGLNSLLNDSLASDTSSNELSSEEFARENPLYSVLTLAIYQDEGGAQQVAEGPVIGYALSTDIAKVNRYLSSEKVRAVFPKNLMFLWSAKPIRDDRPVYALYAIKTGKADNKAPLEGDVIVDARQDFDQFGNADVSMTMNGEGSRRWRRITGENIGKSVAIVLDDQVYSAPTVQAEISGGQSQISGNFTINEAKDLANMLKAGKVPAPARIIEEEIVGPSLGQESINAGLMSLILGLALVILFMVVYYSSSGIISNIALLLNLFFIIGVLASFGAALTLPGMAGIVLTIGMAVDANVIIFERIREELHRGKGVRLAIMDGYKHSYSAIIDANLTTLITGFILLFFGLGPVKGFATVLVIGIFSSLFTAVLISRMLVDWRISIEKPPAFFTKLSKNRFKDLAINFLDKRKMAFTISGIVILIGIASFVMRGFELGVDFKGGRTYVVRFDKNVNTVDIAKSLGDQYDGSLPVVKTFGGGNQVKITTAYMIEEIDPAVDSIVEAKLFSGVVEFFDQKPDRKEFNENNKMSSMKVGPTIADDIKVGSMWATIFSLIGIFFYILIRFRKWQFGAGAVAAIFHDVLIVLSIFSLFNGILPFSLEIDQAFIAALLTIIGYSINDTVVVFDRIREFFVLHPTTNTKDNINNAINATLSRTIMTSFTTLIVVLILFIFGGEMIRGFSFALMVGIFVGTYSSIFIASPILYETLTKGKKGK